MAESIHLHYLCRKHCVKRVRIRCYSGPHFPAFSRIRTEYGDRISPYSVQMRENAGKMRTRITPKTDTFYTVKIATKKKNKQKKIATTLAILHKKPSPNVVNLVKRAK